MRWNIPYGKQSIDRRDVRATVSVLKSDFLTQGPLVPQFEDLISQQVGSGFAVAVSSATAALHAACNALEIGPGDIVWTSDISFVASANCALYCGASVDFVDVDPHHFNISVSSLKSKLKRAQSEGKLPSLLVTVHLGGLPTDQEEIWKLSKEYNFFVIEDASHALGASYHGEPVGSCRYSDITVFSFHPVKIITTAEGGIATTNNAELAMKMAHFRSHGIVRDPLKFRNNSHGDWYYEQQTLGFNYRMNEIQAALGISQLKKLRKLDRARSNIRDYYLEKTTEASGIWFQEQPGGSKSANHLMIAQVPAEKRRSIFENLRGNGVHVNVHYIPIHFQPHHSTSERSDLRNSENYYWKALSLPIYPSLQRRQIDYVISKLEASRGFQDVF